MNTLTPLNFERIKTDQDYRDRVFCLWAAALYFAGKSGDQSKQKLAIEQLAKLGDAVH